MGDSSDEEEQTIADDIVVTKYKMAADMANEVLKTLIPKCVSGASVRELCILGDSLITEKTSKVFKKEKELTKGIGFPTCISVNNMFCHFSPLLSEPDVTLSDGDLVKIDLGAHIDGFIACVGHSIVVGASKENKITGRKADVLLAAYYAAEIALRLVKAGNNNNQVIKEVKKVAKEFDCNAADTILSITQLQQNTIEGEKSTIADATKEGAEHVFELHEVYAVDILLSTGEGKPREQETRTTVYKRSELTYALKMKASRAFYSEVCNKFTMMPFTLRAFEDEKKARLGVGECVNHELLMAYPVLFEKDGEFTAQFKFTVLLMPNGPLRITHGAWEPELIQSEHSIKDEELKALLTTPVSKKTQKKKKKKKPAAASEETQVDETTTTTATADVEGPTATADNIEEGVVELNIVDEPSDAVHT